MEDFFQDLLGTATGFGFEFEFFFKKKQICRYWWPLHSSIIDHLFCDVWSFEGDILVLLILVDGFVRLF